MPGCSNKNRYKSIWPNEETRVILPLRNNRRKSLINNSNSQDVSNANHQNNDQTGFKSQEMTRFSFCERSDSEQSRTSQSSMDTGSDDEDLSATYINANYIRVSLWLNLRFLRKILQILLWSFKLKDPMLS